MPSPADHPPQHVMDGHLWGEGWMLVKCNEREAVIEQHALYQLNTSESRAVSGQFRVLAFWRDETEDAKEDFNIEQLEDMRKHAEDMRRLSA